MGKKGGGFWDNPFGGLFDFNRDGRESSSEQWLAYKIVERCIKRDDPKDDHDYYASALRKKAADISDEHDAWEDDSLGEEWRLFCEDGSDVGIYPEDYDSEEEYEEALSAARVPQPITITVHIEMPGMEALNAIDPADYPNKRKYDAAYHLCDVQQGTAYIPEESSAEAEIERCQFILNSNTLAAQYLTVFNGFLYAQAVKDHFSLPISIPDEDDSIKTYFDDLIMEVAEEDPGLAVEIWGWCIKHFGPYAQYMTDHRTLYNSTMNSINQYPEAFLDIAARTIGADPEFCEGLLTKSIDFPYCCSPIIARALKNGLGKESSLMFIAAILNPAGKGQDMEELIDHIIADCSDWEAVETMELFQQYLLPVIRRIENKRIQRLYPQFAQKAAEYISYVESTGKRYRYSRKNAWRQNCQDGSPYDIDPLDYETEDAYNQAIYEEKYGWRQWAAVDGKKLGIDPAAFETEDAFYAVYDQAWKEDLQKRREEAVRKQQSTRVPSVDPLDKTDKTIYTFCGVIFESNGTVYYYRTDDDTISIGDMVVVPSGMNGQNAVAEVVTVQKHRRATAPYPVDQTKMIKGKREG